MCRCCKLSIVRIASHTFFSHLGATLREFNSNNMILHACQFWQHVVVLINLVVWVLHKVNNVRKFKYASDLRIDTYLKYQ